MADAGLGDEADLHAMVVGAGVIGDGGGRADVVRPGQGIVHSIRGLRLAEDQ